MSRVSRRAALAGAALAPLAGIRPAEAATAPETSPTLAAMRQLIRDHRAAEAHSIALEEIAGHDDLPAYIEARAREKALDAEFDRLWAQPVTCFADVVARAESAHYWNASLEKDNNQIEGANSEYFDERSVARLVEAVLELARRANV
jgi:hypothetical protein